LPCLRRLMVLWNVCFIFEEVRFEAPHSPEWYSETGAGQGFSFATSIRMPEKLWAILSSS